MQLFTLPFLGILAPVPLTGVVYALLVRVLNLDLNCNNVMYVVMMATVNHGGIWGLANTPN